MRPLLAPAVPPLHPSKLQRFLRHARRLALLALGPVESWWTWLFPRRSAPTAPGCSLSPESGLPFPPPNTTALRTDTAAAFPVVGAGFSLRPGPARAQQLGKPPQAKACAYKDLRQ